MIFYHLAIYCENKPGVLARIVNLLRKRNINIEALRVDTRRKFKRIRGVVAVEISIEAGFESAHQHSSVKKQIERLINVLEVNAKCKNQNDNAKF